ncbi:MAG: nuclear transport factor 2 family protein [Acidobacteriota bacterium]
MKKTVTFESHGQKLAGDLYLPESDAPGQSWPAVVVTGAWTTVKEQMAATYAAGLAERGFAALAFDFRGWGQSEGAERFVEDPELKTEDISAAAAFLASRPEVDSDHIVGLGICASSGYMSDAARQNAAIQAIALVAPWLHDAAIVEQVYGGSEGVDGLLRTARNAAAGEEPVVIEAASLTNESALMFEAPYYTEEDRGLIPEYDNRFDVRSWEPWLTYDGLHGADSLTKETLLVHSEAAAIPQGAKEFARRLGEHAETLWLKDVTQFDFYDQPQAVVTAIEAVVAHFRAALRRGDRDRAAIASVVESVGVLADQGRFEVLEQLYWDEVEVDYTSLSGGEVELKSARALMNDWAAVLPGFDRTRHEISNVAVTLDGDRAEATAEVTADHWVGELFWQVEGEYAFELRSDEDDWRISRHVFLLRREVGSRDVFGPAGEKAAAKPPAHLLRQQTEQAVRGFLTALEDKDMERFAELWSDDAVQDMPFSPDGFPKRVHGREGLIAHYAAWPENSGEADFTSQLVFYPMVDPEKVFAEFRGRVEIVPTGRLYEQTYGGLFHVENGKIRLFREYYDPAPFRYAFGLDES